MQTTYKASGYEWNEEVREYLDDRIEDIERLVKDPTALFVVELQREAPHEHGSVYRAEANLNMGGDLFRAVGVGESMNAAIDAMKDEVLRQVKRHKEKHTSFLRRTGAQVKEWMRWGGDDAPLQ